MKTLRALLFVLTCALTGTVHAGALHGGTCFDTQAQAADAFYTSAPPQSYLINSSDYMRTFVYEATGWKTKFYVLSGGQWQLQLTANAPVVTFPSCDPLEKFKDSMQLAWLVGACLLVGFAVKHIRSTL